MGKNSKGGKKHKKYKNSNNENFSKELILADKTNGCQHYFQITKMLGDGRCLGNGSDGRIDVLLIIRGNMRKKIWIRKDDVVLASYRDFGSKPIADIIYKYRDNEIYQLKQMNLFTFGKTNNDIDEFNQIDDNDIGFTFEDL